QGVRSECTPSRTSGDEEHALQLVKQSHESESLPPPERYSFTIRQHPSSRVWMEIHDHGLLTDHEVAVCGPIAELLRRDLVRIPTGQALEERSEFVGLRLREHVPRLRDEPLGQPPHRVTQRA